MLTWPFELNWSGKFYIVNPDNHIILTFLTYDSRFSAYLPGGEAGAAAGHYGATHIHRAYMSA